MADDRRGLRIDDEMPLIIGILHEAERWLSADKLPLARKHHLPGGYLPGNIPAVHVVQDILERRDVHGLVGLALVAVIAVVDRDITDVVLGKIDLDIAAGLDVVSPEAALIFGQDCPHRPRFDVGEHALKPRAVEIPAGIAVVHVVFVGCEAVFFSVVG